MHRRATLFALLTLGSRLGGEVRAAARLARIGYLSPSLASSPRLRDAFLQGLHDLGYVEGRNVAIEYRDAEGKVERATVLAAELVALKMDVIFVAGGTRVTLAVMQASHTIPIVFAGIGDPVESGLVTNLARPRGNATGLSSLGPELVGKRLALLKQAVPTVDRVGVLRLPGALGERTDRDMIEAAEGAARTLALQLHIVEARGADEFERAFSEIRSAHVDALTVLPSNRFLREHRRLVELAAKNRLPAVYTSREFVDAGGLMSYGSNSADLHRRGAIYVGKILKGAKPEDLPVEQPTKFELVINVKTASALGFEIPQSVVANADEVIR
jgi:putative ABC transport system substrate-binding protein